ncbi:MAG: hypothetical protein K1V90_04115 [Muribaculaceae bacterium]
MDRPARAPSLPSLESERTRRRGSGCVGIQPYGRSADGKDVAAVTVKVLD